MVEGAGHTAPVECSAHPPLHGLSCCNGPAGTLRNENDPQEPAALAHVVELGAHRSLGDNQTDRSTSA